MKLLNLELNFTIVTIITLMSCQSNQIDKIQGVFTADKSSLKEFVQVSMKSENALANVILDKAVENAVYEFKIKGDSIIGLMFLGGQTNVINSKIQVRNDSLIAESENLRFHLVPNEKGLLIENSKLKQKIQLIKSSGSDLSNETKNAINDFAIKQKSLQEILDNLGKWQKGNYVDEFGDNTGEGYPYMVVKGEHENSSIINSEVFVKVWIGDNKVSFEILNSSLSLKENLPERKFGSIKIKFPNGDIKTEKVFFFGGFVMESADDNVNIIYNHLQNEQDELKILLDLSTASEFYSDKYQFSVSKNNLDEIIAQLK